jgi:CheY-like chemotaxis protein
MEEQLVYMLEDDSDDRYITESMIKELGLPINIKYFSNSTEFMEFLRNANKGFLILIDYNSKPDNAEDLLRRIKNDVIHAGTPIVILSDSPVTKYGEQCYRLGASSFIQKPSKMDKTKQVIQIFFNYWLTISGINVSGHLALNGSK